MQPTETPQKKLRLPFHYLQGQQVTNTGLRIHTDLQGIDFTPQTKGGRHLTFTSNPYLFLSMDEYKKQMSRLKR